MTDAAVTKHKLPDGSEVDGVLVGVDVSTERWSEYTLTDGTVLRAKVTLSSAIRLEGQYDPSGKPAYAIEAAMTTLIVNTPASLMKKS